MPSAELLECEEKAHFVSEGLNVMPCEFVVAGILLCMHGLYFFFLGSVPLLAPAL